MIERCGGPRLAFEPLHRAGSKGQFWRQKLDGDLSTQVDVSSKKHGGHTTAAQLTLDHVFVLDVLLKSSDEVRIDLDWERALGA